MILVTLRVMALSLWRDRAGLVLVFVLPPLVFVVFASVFGAGISGRLDIRAEFVDQTNNADSHRLIDALRSRLGGRLVEAPNVTALEDAIQSGRSDAGLVIAGNIAEAGTPVTVLIHPGRKAAGALLAAQVNAATQDLPELMLRRETAHLAPILQLKPDQQQRLAAMPLDAARSPPFAAQRVLPGSDPLQIYYGGAVSILFLMFTAMQGAMTLIDERRAGLRLRQVLSAGGIAPLLGGRMLWLTALGLLQALVLFTVAAIAYRVPLLENFAAWAATAICSAAASAGIALGLSAACSTREQAQPVSTFIFLVLAAIGGSMAPRFLMPEMLQKLGWLTPHAWVIDAYQTVLSRGLVNSEVVQAWTVLSCFAAAGFAAALLIEERRQL